MVVTKRQVVRSSSPSLLAILLLVLPACDRNNQPELLDSVADAPDHAKAKALSFPGTPRPDLIGETRWRNSASSSRGGGGTGVDMAMFVIPVVPAGWTADQPVPLWLTSAESIRDPQAWVAKALAHEPPFVGKVVDIAGREPGMRTRSGWQNAIANAESSHGITTHPDAPIVSW